MDKKKRLKIEWDIVIIGLFFAVLGLLFQEWSNETRNILMFSGLGIVGLSILFSILIFRFDSEPPEE